MKDIIFKVFPNMQFHTFSPPMYLIIFTTKMYLFMEFFYTWAFFSLDGIFSKPSFTFVFPMKVFTIKSHILKPNVDTWSSFFLSILLRKLLAFRYILLIFDYAPPKLLIFVSIESFYLMLVLYSIIFSRNFSLFSSISFLLFYLGTYFIYSFGSC